MGLRHLAAASLAASILLATPGGAAFGAPAPSSPAGETVTAADDPPDTEVPSDPEELPPLTEATIDEKQKAGQIVNMPAGSYEEYQKGDYLFTVELWRRAVYDTEVRAGAELAIATYDPATDRCDACVTFIRTNIYHSHQRDVLHETSDRLQALDARTRRQLVATMVDYTFPDGSAVGLGGDRNFIFRIWEHLLATKPWARRTIAAAAAAVTASAEAQVEFLTKAGILYFFPDQTDELTREADGDVEEEAELLRRAARKSAAGAVGVTFGPVGNEDEAWYVISDTLFLDRLYTKVEDDSQYKITKDEIAIVLYDHGATEWRAFIDKGIHEAVLHDQKRLSEERRKDLLARVTVIRDQAEKLAYKNRAIAANTALAVGTYQALTDFERHYDKLPPDASDITAFYDYGTAPSGMWVFGHVGRNKGTARKVWTSPAGWRAVNAAPISGEFDGKVGRDAAVLYKVAAMSYRLEVFPRADALSSPPRTAWELKPASANVGYTLQSPVAADVNGDGLTDVAVYGTDPAKKPILMTLYAEADGTFRQQVTSVPTALVAGRAAAGDVNGDSKDDLVTFVQDATKGAQMWLSVAGGDGYAAPVLRWSNATVKLAEAGTPVIGDFDRDKRAEVAMFRKETTTASLWIHDNLATGTVSFAKKWTSPSGWTFDALHPVATDVNGDNRTDLAVMQRIDAAKVSIWSIRAKAGGFDPAHSSWTSGKGSWRIANSRIAR
jgi:hypothetical protein